MEKEEILKRSRASRLDEGVEYADDMGRKLGLVLFATVAGCIAILSVSQQDFKTFCVTMGLIFTFLASQNFGRFYWGGKKTNIIGIIASVVAAIFLFANYIVISFF